MSDTEIQDPIAELITNYNELNSSQIDQLPSEPSPLEFMRYVSKNTPFVVRGAALTWKATQTWTVPYLKSLLGETTQVNVAVTPSGNADSPYSLEQNGTTSLVFVKPHEEYQPFGEFLDFLTSSNSPTKEVRYAQTQNDNLRNEYLPLFSHVERTIPFARIALDCDPDAINMWIGTSHSTTALHKDNYENIYVQISGQKHFVLLPPICQPCVNEQMLEPAHYVRLPCEGAIPVPDSTDLGLVMEPHSPYVPFATWDPDSPMLNETEYSCLARPMKVTLNPGDMLYLPAMWYHKVSQSCKEGEVCVAVNYWYDMEFTGPLYPLTTFVRSVFNKEREIESDIEDEDGNDE
ncbi:JmjC domain-containing protein 7 [Podospora fimiseda]|uniref:JmjC domain-containing protein 7 n=1 Tax=Podospora fimiseda TaxID=252190 RepID=A0AAN7BPS9_9PEZI|nr:JmjC domain-containing protein 7 [Podospora fimiseda]